ncbi:MAG: DUF5011 domain-containing protein [Atopobiaceae bacterium]|nr:DUF5011 domain-containing protein [Atopobiaceae bacterium]
MAERRRPTRRTDERRPRTTAIPHSSVSGAWKGEPPRLDRSIIVLAALCTLILALIVLGMLRICTRGSSGREGQPTADSVVITDAEAGADADAELAPDGRITMTLCGGHETIVRTGEAYVEPGCLARDAEEGSLSDRMQVSGDVDTSKPGTYTVTYTVVNDAGMTARAERTVRVTDEVDAGWDEDGISVMMYHYVYDPSDPPEYLDANYVSTGELSEQLAWLVERGFYFPSWAELRAYVDGTHSLPDKSVILTFDDGEYGFLNLGIPLLEQYGIPATSFIECSRGDIEEVLTTYASPYVCFESHSYDLHHAGYTPIGHGGAIYDLSEDELVDDLQHAVDILGSHCAFAYPYGDVSDVSAAAVNRVGIYCSFTTEYDRVYPGDDPTALPRVRVSGDSGIDVYTGSVW